MRREMQYYSKNKCHALKTHGIYSCYSGFTFLCGYISRTFHMLPCEEVGNDISHVIGVLYLLNLLT